jgi:hypothetical protein
MVPIFRSLNNSNRELLRGMPLPSVGRRSDVGNGDQESLRKVAAFLVSNEKEVNSVF